MKNFTLDKRIPNIAALILILALAVVPLWATGTSGLIEKTDTEFPLHPSDIFQRYLYVWSSDFNFGYDQSVTETYKLPILGVEALLEQMRVPLWLINRAIFAIPLLLMGLGMFLLTSLATENVLPRFLSAAFFMYNPMVVRDLVNGQWLILLGLSMISFMLFFLIKGLDTKRGFLKYALGIGLASLFIRPVNIMYAGLIVLAMYALFHFIANRTHARMHTARFVGLSLALALCLNLWFVLPFLNAIRIGDIAYSMGQEGFLEMTSSWLSIFSGARLVLLSNSPTFMYDFYSALVDSHLFLATSSLLLVLAILALWKRPDRLTLFFGIAFVTFLFLGKGLAAPFGQPYLWLFNHFPGFSVLRTPHHFLELLTIPYAFLLGVSLANIISRLGRLRIGAFFKKYGHKLFSVIVLGLILMNSAPLLTGNLAGWLEPIHVPPYYEESALWLNEQPDVFNVMVPRITWVIKYEWTPYALQFIYRRFSDKPLLEEYDVDRSSLIPKAFLLSCTKTIESGNQATIGKSFLRLGNVKYILIGNDMVESQFYISHSSVERELLENLKGIHLEKSFGKLDFYRNEFWQPLHIYTASSALLIDGGVGQIPKAMASPGFSPSEFALFLSNELKQPQIEFIQDCAIITSIHYEDFAIPVDDGWSSPFSWSSLQAGDYAAKYYSGWKCVIRTDGTEADDTLSFNSLDEAPYEFPSYSPMEWNGLNATLIFIKTGDEALTISSLAEDAVRIRDVVGVWWQTGWMGMEPQPVPYPITIPPNEKAIIQINHMVEGKITFTSSDFSNIRRQSSLGNTPEITTQRMNPTKYQVRVTNATQPFFLVLSESYHPSWKAYHGKVNWLNVLWKKPIHEDRHLMANGYANSWYIDPQEVGESEFDVSLYYWPQSLFYLGAMISGLTFVSFIGYAVWNRRRATGAKYKSKV